MRCLAVSVPPRAILRASWAERISFCPSVLIVYVEFRSLPLEYRNAPEWIFASLGCGLDADDEPLSQDPQRLRQGAQLGSVLWVEQAPHLFLVFANLSAELGFADAGLAEGVEKRELCGNRRLHRNRDEVAPSRLGFRQRKMAVRIRQQRQPERLLRLRHRVGLTFPLGDRLRDIRETHHDHAALLAGLEAGSIHKSCHCTLPMCTPGASGLQPRPDASDLLRRLWIDLPRRHCGHLERRSRFGSLLPNQSKHVTLSPKCLP